MISVHSAERIIKFRQQLTELRQNVTGVLLIMCHRVVEISICRQLAVPLYILTDV